MKKYIIIGSYLSQIKVKKSLTLLLSFSFILFACLLTASNGALAMDMAAFKAKYGQIRGFAELTTPQVTKALNRVGVEAGTYVFKPTRDDKTKLFVPAIVYKGGSEPIKLDPALTAEQVENEILKLKHTKILTHPLLITIRTQDNQDFQVEEPLANLSLTIKHLIEDTGTEVVFPLPTITAKTWGILQEQLARVYDVAQKGAGAKEAEIEIRRSLKSLDNASLIDIITALNYLDIPDFLHLAMDVAKAIEVKNITPAQIATLPREIRNPIISAQMQNILGQFNAELLKIYKAGILGFNQACVTPDNRKIVAGYRANHISGIFVLDIKDGKQLLEIKVPAYGVESVCVTPDGNKIVAGIEDGTIRIFDINDGKQQLNDEKKPLEIKAGIAVGSVAVTPDGTKIVASFLESRGEMEYVGHSVRYKDEVFTIRVWDMQGNQHAQCNGHTGHILSICVTPDGSKIVSASNDGTIRIWDINTGTQIREFEGDKDGVISICITPDGKKIVSGSAGDIIRVWDINNGKQLREIKVEDTRSKVCVTPDGTKIVAGYQQGKLQVWDINNGEKLLNFILGYSEVASVCVTPDGSKVVAADHDTIHVLDISLLYGLSKITQEQAQKIWQYLQADHKAGWAGIADILK